MEELQAGDRIAAPATLPELGTERWPHHKAALLGWILAKGNTNHTHGAYLYSKTQAQVDDMVTLASQFANTRPTVKVRPDRQNVQDIYLGQRHSRQHRRQIRRAPVAGRPGLGRRQGHREAFACCRLPPSTNASLAALVGRYWSGDGFLFGAGNTTPYAATSSRGLAEDLQHILLRLGIVSKLSEKHFAYVRGEDTAGRTGYTVHLLGRRSLERFLEVVAPHIAGRDEALENLRVYVYYAATPANRETVDTLPASVKALVQTAKAGSGLTWTQLEAQSGVCTKEFYGSPKAYKKGFRRSTIQQLGAFLEAPELLDACSDDLYWDTILSITPAGEAQTYDLEVPGTHNFVANDLIVHNSHSAAYGVITYQTAWLKANYPVEFMAALLTVERRDSDKVAEYASDARKMGVDVLPPDINRSGADFRVQGEQIYFGLYAIKGLGEQAVIRILDERERAGVFKSLADFCSRIDSKTCNRKGLDSLIKSGAFDAYGERKQLLESVDEALAWAQGAASMLNSGMDALFGMAETAPEPGLRQNVPPLGELEKLSLEKEALGPLHLRPPPRAA